MMAWLIFGVGFALGMIAGATAVYAFIIEWANTPRPTRQEAYWEPLPPIDDSYMTGPTWAREQQDARVSRPRMQANPRLIRRSWVRGA